VDTGVVVVGTEGDAEVVSEEVYCRSIL